MKYVFLKNELSNQVKYCFRGLSQSRTKLYSKNINIQFTYIYILKWTMYVCMYVHTSTLVWYVLLYKHSFNVFCEKSLVQLWWFCVSFLSIYWLACNLLERCFPHLEIICYSCSSSTGSNIFIFLCLIGSISIFFLSFIMQMCSCTVS